AREPALHHRQGLVRREGPGGELRRGDRRDPASEAGRGQGALHPQGDDQHHDGPGHPGRPVADVQPAGRGGPRRQLTWSATTGPRSHPAAGPFVVPLRVAARSPRRRHRLRGVLPVSRAAGATSYGRSRSGAATTLRVVAAMATTIRSVVVLLPTQRLRGGDGHLSGDHAVGGRSPRRRPRRGGRSPQRRPRRGGTVTSAATTPWGTVTSAATTSPPRAVPASGPGRPPRTRPGVRPPAPRPPRGGSRRSWAARRASRRSTR